MEVVIVLLIVLGIIIWVFAKSRQQIGGSRPAIPEKKGKKHAETYGILETTKGIYEGDLVNGEPHGQGVFSFNDGGRYEGSFVKGAFTGKGKMTYTFPTSGYRYEGDFVNGNRHGKGVYTFPSGIRYEGNFADNDIHGYGTKYAPDGSVIQKGRWNHHKFVGKEGDAESSAERISASSPRPKSRLLTTNEEVSPPPGRPDRIGPLSGPEGEVWQPGHLILNRFQISAVKRGSMGLIYFCKYFADMVVPCVIKTLPKRLLLEHREFFFQEMSTWVKLGKHPNIVWAFGAQEIEERPCLLLEYVAGDVQHGSDLSGWIGTAALDLRRAMTFAWQICTGMCYAADKFHALGKAFVHRDLKPTNLLVASPEQVKISDFGIALLRDLTQTGRPLGDMDFGNRVYRSPEQCRRDPQLDIRADIYAFGCVLYEMLTGKTVFDLPRTSPEFFQSHLHKIPQSPKQLNPGIPSAIDDLVMKCLEKEPGARYPDFAILQNEIRQIYEHLFSVPPANPLTEQYKLNQEGVQLTEAVTKLFLGKPQEALKNLESIENTQLTSTAASTLILKAEALAKTGQTGEAVRLLEDALKRLPEEIGLWNEKGRLLADVEQYEEALACFERARDLDHYDPLILNNMAYALLGLNRPEDALTCLEECLVLNPRWAAAWNSKGRAYAALEKWEQASQCYEHSVTLNPAEAEVWFNWSVAAANLYQKDNEKAHLRKCLIIDPNHWKALHNLAVFLREKEATEDDQMAIDEAICCQKLFVSGHPQNLNFLAQLTATLLALARKAEVLDLLADFLSQDSIEQILTETVAMANATFKSISLLEAESANQRLIAFFSLYLEKNLAAEGLITLALGWSEEIIARHPERGRLYLAKGLMQLIESSAKTALATFNEGLKYIPDDPLLLHYKGEALRLLEH